MNNQSRQLFFEALPFICLAVAVVAQAIQPLPSGPWDGIYTNFELYWILIGFACASMLAAIHQYQLSWTIVGGFAVLLLFAVISHSFLWATPWGVHDSWRHLGDIHDRRLAFTENVYPLFHILIIEISLITGFDSHTVLSGLMLLVAPVGVMFTIVVARYTDTSTTAQQAATIVILPGLFVGFIPRPFTLAYPFLLVGFWLSQSRSTGMKIASSLLLVTLVLFHPFIALLTVSIVLVAMALKRSLQWRSFGQLSIGRPSVSIYILIAVGLELSYVLFVASGFSNNLIFGFSEMFFGPSVTGPGGPAGVGLIAEAFSDPKKFQELLLRSSFLLSLALASTIALVVQYRRRHFASESVVAVLSGLCVFGLFLILSFLPTGVGVTRLFILAPLFFLPLIPYAFSTQTPTRKFASIGLAVLIVTSGLLTGFLWPGIGGVEYSATEPQVVGVEWATEHVATEIVGTSMTHWIVVGKYGRETSTELSARDVNGMLATRLQNGSYSWEVTDRPPSALYVIDGAERARARQSASESDDRPIQCLHAFQLNQMKVYSNGDTNAFVLSQRPACGATS